MVLVKKGNSVVETVDKFIGVLVAELIVVHLMAAITYDKESSVLG